MPFFIDIDCLLYYNNIAICYFSFGNQKNCHNTRNNRITAMRKYYFNSRLLMILLRDYVCTLLCIFPFLLVSLLINRYFTITILAFCVLLTLYYFGGFVFILRKYNKGQKRNGEKTDAPDGCFRVGKKGIPYSMSGNRIFCSVGFCSIDNIASVKIEQKTLLPNHFLNLIFLIVSIVDANWIDGKGPLSPPNYALLRVVCKNDSASEAKIEKLIILFDIKKEYEDFCKVLNDTVPVDSLDVIDIA